MKPTPPPTHIALPLNVRDAMIKQLGEVPLKYGIEAVAKALHAAPMFAMPAQPSAKSAPPDAPPARRIADRGKKRRKPGHKKR